MALNCPSCDAHLREGLKYCQYCGHELPVTEASLKCARCGARNEGDVKFCGECGQFLLANSSVVGQETPPTSVETKTYWTPGRIILLTAIVTLILGGLIYGFSTGVTTGHNFEISISSSGCWSGAIDVDSSGHSVQGCGAQQWFYSGKVVGTDFQMTGTGYSISLTITRDGSTCAQQTSSADYGVVSAGC